MKAPQDAIKSRKEHNVNTAGSHRTYRDLDVGYAYVAVQDVLTRNSAIADKPRDTFTGQSRSPNMVPFHMIGMVSY